MPTNNKIKYGIKNVYYAVATIDESNAATYGTPVRIPGAVSLSLDAQGDASPFYADNIVYWMGQNNNGYEGDLEVAMLPDSFRTDVLQELVDSNGVLVEAIADDAVHFALIFQFEGDKTATRHVMYNCTASRPGVSGSTKEEDIEPQTETVTITAKSVYNSALDKDLVKARIPYSSVSTDPYQTITAAVYQPSALAT